MSTQETRKISRESSPVREHRCKLCKTNKTNTELICEECQAIKNIIPGIKKVISFMNDGPRFTLTAGNVVWYAKGRGGKMEQVLASLEKMDTMLSEIIDDCTTLREQVRSLLPEKQS